MGQRLPFAAPIGSCFAAWGDDATRRRWIAPVAATVSPQQREALLRVPDLVRQRGYAIAVGHEQGAHLEEVATKLNAGDPQIPAAALHEAMVRALEGYNTLVEPDEPIELRSLSARCSVQEGG